MNQTLANPVGSTYVYSDLSMITLMYVVGTLALDLGYINTNDLLPQCVGQTAHGVMEQCYYEAYVRKYVFLPLGMKNTMFLPPKNLWANCAPTENDTSYLNRVIQGQVSDGNSYALGGIAGHAGLFSNLMDMSILMRRLMFAAESDDVFLNRTTVQFFITEFNHSQSSRALGWNTNDPTVFDYGWNQTCGEMSAKTFTHTGYTGTQLCGDPTRKLITILLTNRVYPTDTNNQIRQVRKDFNTAVVNIVDQHFPVTARNS